MSRRRASAGDPRKGSGVSPEDPQPARNRGGQSVLLQIAIVIGAFAVGTLLAELFGADSLGVAIGVGQIVFAIALVAVLLRGS